MTISVLDTGFVRLVDHMGSDLSVVRAARVSYNADWRAGSVAGSDERLIEYLLKNKHTSPFEAVTFTFEVKAPMFIFRQWHRHRTWSFNEVSARYTELDEGFYLPALENITTQAVDNKQARTTAQHPEAGEIRQALADSFVTAHTTYKKLLDMGTPRELARAVLPVAAYSRMFATVDLHNLLNFLRLRMHSHAQWEIRQYANALCDIAGSICPVTIRAFRGTQA